MTTYAVYVGIDVSADEVSVQWLDDAGELSELRVFAQSKQGYRQLMKWLARSGQAAEKILVVMEATGVYWMALAHVLSTAGYQVSVGQSGCGAPFCAQLASARQDRCPGYSPVGTVCGTL
jgi:hypothetical protein